MTFGPASVRWVDVTSRRGVARPGPKSHDANGVYMHDWSILGNDLGHPSAINPVIQLHLRRVTL
jgi:hypothetical protein